MTSRKPKKVNLETSIDLPVIVSNDSILNELLAGLETIEGNTTLESLSNDEIVEDGAVQAGTSVGDESLLEGVIAEVERVAAKTAIYADQESAGADGSAPETTTDAISKKKSKGTKAAKEPKAAKPPKEPKPPKELRATSVTHKPGDLMKVKLGAKVNEFLVFSLDDAVKLDQAGIEAKADEFILRMNDKDLIADKVREKIIMFFVWMAKGGGDLNEVIRRAITVLHENGELTSGDKGNLQLNLLSKPYSIGTARSQANQVFMMLPELGICVKEKGRMIPNPNSALLPIVKSMLGL